jgi:redox-sensitive bicupin YhaK (pirin superfamily)
LIVGTLYDARSPVAVFSEMFYADAELRNGARLDVPAEHDERAIYVVAGRIEIAGASIDAGRLIVLGPEADVAVAASGPARLLLFGGAPLDAPRHLWWNFVSSSRERIEQAKEDWKAGRFAPVPGETEFIPLPE